MAQKLITGNSTPLKWTVGTSGDFETGNTADSVASQWQQKSQRSVAIGLIWTGTTEGTLTILVSNDGTNTAQTLAVTDFTPAMTNPAGSASNTCCQLTTTFPFFKVNFARSAGTGTITGTVTVME